MRIGVTGHTNMAADSVPLVAAEIRKALSEFGLPLIGVSCLARGADQVFARVILELGGQLHVVLPAADYRERKVKPDNREEFEALISQTASVKVLPFETSNRDAYAAANEEVLGSVDALVAVWDGTPSDGKGGTGDTVQAARRCGVPVSVVWPNGASRLSDNARNGVETRSATKCGTAPRKPVVASTREMATAHGLRHQVDSIQRIHATIL